MKRIVFADAALEDLRSIQAYYKAPSRAADRFTDQIGAAMDRLSHFPGIATRRPEFTRKNVRFSLVSPYWIVLEVKADVLTVITVLHCSRNVARELNRRIGMKRS